MWFICAIITTLIWGLAELFYKKGANPDEKYSHLKICICVGFVMTIHAIYVLLTQNIDYNFINIIKYFPVSFCYIISMTFSFFGMRFIEESISDPIENTSGAITALLCFFILKQSISIVALIGVVLVIVGIVLLSLFEAKDENGRKKKIGKKLAIIAFMMPFLYAIFDASGTFLDAYYLELETSPLVGITEENIELVANTSYELTFGIVALILSLFMIIKREKLDLQHQKDKWLAAICETAGQFTYVYAMSGVAIIAAPIISSVCVVSVILSRIFLKEKLLPKQYLAIGTVILGILLLSVTDA
ncbi:MAG: DMT family transporter [Clostridia bacterium]|nr:DMT family transporter [Clostridia bacterium]